MILTSTRLRHVKGTEELGREVIVAGVKEYY